MLANVSPSVVRRLSVVCQTGGVPASYSSDDILAIFLVF